LAVLALGAALAVVGPASAAAAFANVERNFIAERHRLKVALGVVKAFTAIA
jgi:hypothetical protein